MHKKFLNHAIALAKKNAKSLNGGPFGAVIVKQNKIIATGTNGVTKNNDPTAHAEISAIRAACKKLKTFNLSGCTLYSSCEPCPMCLSAIYWARLDALYYAGSKKDAAKAGFDDAFIAKELILPSHRRSLPIKQTLKNEGKKPFTIWRGLKNKIPY